MVLEGERIDVNARIRASGRAFRVPQPGEPAQNALEVASLVNVLVFAGRGAREADGDLKDGELDQLLHEIFRQMHAIGEKVDEDLVLGDVLEETRETRMDGRLSVSER